jgi:hypothetical protein
VKPNKSHRSRWGTALRGHLKEYVVFGSAWKRQKQQEKAKTEKPLTSTIARTPQKQESLPPEKLAK